MLMNKSTTIVLDKGTESSSVEIRREIALNVRKGEPSANINPNAYTI